MVHKAKSVPFMSEAAKEVSQDQVLEEINKAKSFLEANQADLPEKVYSAMDGFSRTALQFLNTKGAQGWAAAAQDATGNAIWTGAEAEAVEAALPAVIVQAGGGPIPGFKLGTESSLIQSAEIPDVSLDKMYHGVRNFLASIDEKNREIAQTIGPVAFITKMQQDPQLGPFPPYLPLPLKFPAGLILPLFNSILESCRLLVSTNTFNQPLLRQILSIVLAVLDVSRGEWRNGVLSLLGVFNTNLVFAGVVGKTARWIYNFISPDLQEQLEDDIFKSAKSMFVGFWLWLLSVVSPDYVRASINNLFETGNKAIESAQTKLGDIQEKAIASGAQMGLQVTFPKFPLERLPSFDDIQNLQSLFHRPEIICSAEFQQVLQPALGIPPVRVLLELMNFPTDEEAKASICAGRPASVAEALTQSMTPTVAPVEPKKGGTRRRRQRPTSRRHKR